MADNVKCLIVHSVIISYLVTSFVQACNITFVTKRCTIVVTKNISNYTTKLYPISGYTQYQADHVLMHWIHICPQALYKTLTTLVC